MGYALGVAFLFFAIALLYEAVAAGDLDPITARPIDVTGDYFKSYYTMPWNRAQTYIVGIACGYVMNMYSSAGVQAFSDCDIHARAWHRLPSRVHGMH